MLIYVFGTYENEEEFEMLTENILYKDIKEFANSNGYTHCVVYTNIGNGYRGERLCEFNF